MDLFIGGSYVSIITIALVEVMIVCVLTTAAVSSNVDAQANDLSPSQANKNKTAAASSGGSIDVSLEPTPNPVKSGEKTQYKITFMKKNTDTVQVHVDYDFMILKDNNTEVFRASQQTGQPLLHTAEGIVTIPFVISEPGRYTARVSVMGINFIPISTEYAEFPITVVKG
jgi:archaellum component FlaG (FlaF/FlaG flagellin family)